MDAQLDALERSFANQLDKYWAKMRSTKNLLERSEHVNELQVEAFRHELSDILDHGIINYPQTLTEIGLSEDMSYQDVKRHLGLISKGFNRTENESKFLMDMFFKAADMRKSNWAWRIAQEAKQKQELDWYPFFVTLTVDPKRQDPKTLWVEGRELRKYIRRLCNVVCKELGHPPAHKKPYRPESDYVTYAGVIEHGKSREHHHAHFLIWLRAIPADWRVCPNEGRLPQNRDRNECLPMRTLWRHSAPKLSPALYFRTVGDVWERKHNFVLPLKDGKPMKVSKPEIAGLYVTKYLSKEHKQWNHRVKATRNLGLNKLKALIKTLPDHQVRALTWRAKDSNSNHLLTKIHSVPLGLVRQLTKQEDFLRMFRANKLDLKTLLTSNSQVFLRMLKSVRSGQRPDRMDSLDYFDWVGSLLPDQEGFSEKQQFEAHTKLNNFFDREISKISHTKLGANKIGHSLSV